MSGTRTVEVALSQPEAVAAVTAALAEQGFGVLTSIDVAATLKAKLGTEVDDFVILGACNPALAHRALAAEPEIGLLLPCNVTVRQAGGRTLVQAVDPIRLLAMASGPAGAATTLTEVARDASERLSAVLDVLERRPAGSRSR